ncbi:MAG: 23S rRNA (adenine(2503)-C(2))-methyltransferase RlmN [Prevotellaceae bacterium]|nr:23S rRNA (adenine(2503)-C(2))-methyltransferase RlmN [Candidatus Minthosoma equi]
MDKTPLLGKTLEELQDLCLQLSMPKFTAKQIAQWIYGKHIHTIEEMTNISKANREKLASLYCVGCSEPVEISRSVDGTIKYLFPTENGKFIESVYIPDGDRATLCVSCQVGCKMNCLFCQTGKQGWNGDLTVTDILNQIYSVDQMMECEGGTMLTNVVYMGQGEPLDNMDNVMKSTEILTADYGWAWSPRRITVSTVGLKKNLRRFLDESECHLAISLHTPIHEQRQQLMPAEKQFAISEIIELLKEYDWSHQRRITFEYTMFGGTNDSTLHAKELTKLLRGLDCRVNLIRWHKIPDVPLKEVETKSMESFRDYLNNHGITTTIRASRGQDIWAACGLLSTKKQLENQNI